MDRRVRIFGICPTSGQCHAQIMQVQLLVGTVQDSPHDQAAKASARVDLRSTEIFRQFSVQMLRQLARSEVEPTRVAEENHKGPVPAQSPTGEAFADHSSHHRR
uniref:(northern house mosquito) hypothetical protein n=1 Tax=Culex pipiens TaxID=7175 RepID=A0A8D8EQZ7_CULPI